jgi:hypothetical protein
MLSSMQLWRSENLVDIESRRMELSTPPKLNNLAGFVLKEKENVLQTSTSESPRTLYPKTATPHSTPMISDTGPSNLPKVRRRLQDISLTSTMSTTTTGNSICEEPEQKGHRTTRAVVTSRKEYREWRDQDPVATTLLQENGKGDGIVHMIGTLTDTSGLVRPVATRWKR